MSEVYETAVIARERDYELYVVDVPVYRGMESWSGLRDEAYHFESEAEAAEMLTGMLSRKPDLVYIHIEVKDGKEIVKERSNFQVSMNYAPHNSRLWFVKNKTEIEALNTAFQEAKLQQEEGVKNIRITNQTEGAK